MTIFRQNDLLHRQISKTFRVNDDLQQQHMTIFWQNDLLLRQISTIFIPNNVLQQQLMHILDEITIINDKQLPFLDKMTSYNVYCTTIFRQNDV